MSQNPASERCGVMPDRCRGIHGSTPRRRVAGLRPDTLPGGAYRYGHTSYPPKAPIGYVVASVSGNDRVQPAVPKLRAGSYFPAWLLERRSRSERVMISVVATCYPPGCRRAGWRRLG